MSSDANQASLPIPIILIAGYLGSGKTTYLNHLLSEANGRKLAVLVNDFGAINIDANLIEGSVDDVVALQNGCICCSMAAGMQSAILKVLKRETKPELILIEASGVANPGEIIKILSDDSMQPFASLELVISMLDCQNMNSYKPTELGLIKEQIRHSGLIMLTKLEQASTEDITLAKEVIRENNPGAVIIEDYQKILNLDLLLGTKQEPLKGGDNNSANTQANELFKSWNYSCADALSEAEFQKVLQDLPSETVRGKGFLYLKNYPTVRLEFQMVGKTAQIQPKGDWGFQNPRTEIVFIALKN
jgi:G3E family GTPase